MPILAVVIIIMGIIILATHIHNKRTANHLNNSIKSLTEYSQYRDVKYEISYYSSDMKNETYISVAILYNDDGYNYEKKSFTLAGSSQMVGENFIYSLLEQLPPDRFYIQRAIICTVISEYPYGKDSIPRKWSSASRLQDRMRELSPDDDSRDNVAAMNGLVEKMIDSYYRLIERQFENQARVTPYNKNKEIKTKVEIDEKDIGKLLLIRMKSLNYGNGIILSSKQVSQTWEITPTSFGINFYNHLKEKCLNEGVSVSIEITPLLSGTPKKNTYSFQKHIFKTGWIWCNDEVRFSASIHASIKY